ncbi:MAG TPA: hypothetical protein VKA70_21035 [Blastocatellia bacterium]|nr:hypothetical protein [Blastocatellia bacterium]
MSSQKEGSDQEPYYIFTEEEAGRLVTEALETSLDEPEPFIRLLLMLHDQERESRLQDSIYILMKAAYKGSIADDKNFEGYLEAIRQGKDPVE